MASEVAEVRPVAAREDLVPNHADNIDDAFMDRLKEHFSEAQIVELTIALGTWDWVHKFNKVFDVDPPVTDGLFIVGLPDVPPEMRQHLVDGGSGQVGSKAPRGPEANRRAA